MSVVCSYVNNASSVMSEEKSGGGGTLANGAMCFPFLLSKLFFFSKTKQEFIFSLVNIFS